MKSYKQKLIALLEGLEVRGVDYFLSQSPEVLKELGSCIADKAKGFDVDAVERLKAAGITNPENYKETKMNSYELYDAAEDLMKKWHKRWNFCLKIGLVLFLSGIVLGLFLNRPSGILVFFAFLWCGISACFFVSPKNKEHELRRQAIAQWGKNEEEYW